MMNCQYATVVLASIIGCAASITGCMRIISIEKNDPVCIQSTNGVEYVDGGYSVNYKSIGLKTDVSSIEAAKTDKGVRVKIAGVQTDVSTENKEIVSAGGTAVGNVAEKVIEGIKGVETIKTNQ